MNELLERVENLSENKRKLLELMNARHARVTSYPLSYAQQRLWIIDQLEPGSAAYNIPCGLRLFGELDKTALRKSIQEIIRRHEILRTTFPERNGVAIQEAAPALQVKIDESNLRDLAPEVQQERLRRAADTEATAPFDLVRGPLLRVKLIQVGSQEHVLLVTMHHIVSDGWSAGVMVRELTELYNAYSAGKESPLPELKIQYGNFALWQRGWLQGEILKNQLEYWRTRLEGIKTLELPTDYAYPAVPTYAAAFQRITISQKLTQDLRDLSRREGVTLFMTLLASFQVLLARYNGQWDIAIGTPVANRNREETESLIGLFMNTLILRTQMEPSLSFKQVLNQVRDVTLGAFAHQDLPFEKLVEELDPERNLGRNPLFQVLFTLQNTPGSQLRLGKIRMAPEPMETGKAKLDLSLGVIEDGKVLSVDLEYRSELFAPLTTQRLLRHWETLLHGVVTDPTCRIAALPLLSQDEKHAVTVEWNQTKAEYAREKGVAELFEEQVARTPKSIAVEFESRQWSYEELNRRSNHLAHYLQQQGIGAETLVGICLERGLEMMVALLGTLKAGAAYVPLDPGYPAERIGYVLEDAQAAVLLSEESLLEQLPGYGGRIVALDQQWEEISRESGENPQRQVAARNLAYVIYTSGSTGKPKGVQIEQQAVVNFLTAMTRQPQIRAEDVLLAVTTLSFDIAGLELYLPLVNGARVRIASREVSMDGRRLRQEVERGVTVLQATPASWLLLLEAGWQGSGKLKVLCGGEALSADLAGKLVARSGSTWNMYGPTETTIWSLVEKIEGAVERVAIGRPIANTEAYVLDEEMEPVPVGVAGELYIGGDGLARGYFRRSELTAERFVPSPFSAAGGERLYRTGDLARYQGDGKLECLGRIDQQVKIRGYRIELGEIEAALQEQAGVKQAVVVAGEEESGQKRLVGYVVSREGEEVVVGRLREELKQRLPEYMVPGMIVKLESLPLTPNGKIDRKALPAPQAEEGRGEETYIAPRTPMEEIVAGIWGEVLKVERVGAEDNFFELGGHSLLATRVMSRVRKSVGVELPLKVLFEGPTVAALAAIIENALQTAVHPELIEIHPVSRDGALPLSFSQQRLWFIQQLEPQSGVYNMPFGLRIRGKLDKDALRLTFNEIIRRHEVLRTTFPTQERVAVQKVADRLEITVEENDLRGLSAASQEEEVLRAKQKEVEQPFDLENGPLLRLKLLQLQEQEHVLLLTMHHIVGDGWSVGILVSEIGQIYEAYRHGIVPELPALEIQYADYAVWQRNWLQGTVLEEQLAYWRKALAGTTMLELPTDHPRQVTPSYAGASERIMFSRELTHGLQQLSRSEGVTLFMTLMAGLQVLLARYTGQWDVAVGTLVANRNRQETERLIGFFMNTLVLRARMHSEQSFRETLRQMREITLGGYAHQDLPFEKLVEELDPERKLGRNPLFQALFTMQNMPSSQLQLGGIELSAEPIEVGTSKFDLGLFVEERTGGLAVGMEYSSELFDRKTIQRMLQNWEVLLRGAVANPEARLSDLPLLTETESRRILLEWNFTQQDYPRELCLNQLFELQAEKTPDAVAVEYEDSRLTYQELNARANQLARHLRKQGIGPEALAGICMERSLEMFVAILGVIKAGGAYVPLDPNYPQERLSYMLQDSDARVLLTHRSRSGHLPQFNGTTLELETEWNEIGRESSANLENLNIPENLAYVIYTSGSTGQPKGVLMQHRGVLNLTRAQQQTFAIMRDDCILQFSSSSFDASVWEIWMAWANGARLHATRKENLIDSERLSQIITQKKITVATLPPSLVSMMKPTQLEGITRLIVGGEASPASILNFISSSRKLFNVYGPTEITCVATLTECVEGKEKPPIGRAIANTRAYVLDESMNPVPAGVAGELYIGSPALARGYFHRPELTAERFVPDPFSEASGARLYRSGDRVRYRADGNIEFMGRFDDQVKIRGHRIELGEIQALLDGHPSIEQAVVVVREDSARQQQLIGYVVMDSENSGSALDHLRQYLQERLPEYMVPAHLVRLQQMPLTANNKVDKKALPAPDSKTSLEYTAPRDADEEILCGIWSTVLELERVGIHDGFFHLGGHSLLATQLISQIRSIFKVELPLRALFEAPTVAGLADRLKQMRGAVHSFAPVLGPAARSGDIPLSFAQQRLWFIDQFQPGTVAYNLPLGLRLTGSLDRVALHRSFTELIRRHEILRTTFQTHEGIPVQRIMPNANFELELIDLQQLSEDERELAARRLARDEAGAPFDLSVGPLLRAKLLRLDQSDHVLLVTMHHIISDGWSIMIMVKEFASLYEAFCKKQELALPELKVQYADFAIWQRQWLQGELLDKQLEYWKQQLAEVPPLELPLDHVRPAVMSHRGGSVSFQLSKELTDKLKDLSQRQGVTLFMSLVAALHLTLSKYSGQRDIATGTIIANRNRKETESLVGFFANTVVLRSRIADDLTLRHLLQQVRQTTLEAYEHQDVPFEKLVEELQVDRDLSRSPLFQVMFSLRNMKVSRLPMAGLQLADFNSEAEIAKFELDFELAEWDEGLGGTISYSSELYEATTVREIAQRFRLVLQTIAENENSRVGDLSLLTEAERDTLLHAWNDTVATRPSICVHKLFEQQAARTPEAIAVESCDRQLTYRELNQRANQLAHYLKTLGIAPECRIGICVNRDLEMLVGLLGILKAGAAYVPLDSAHPAERLQYVMEDSGIGLLLTSSKLANQLPAFQVNIIQLDQDWPRITAQSTENPDVRIDPANLIYMIYTSGSTGKPKGVQICHEALMNFLLSMSREPGICAEDVLLAVTTLSFDIAALELYLPLICGARVRILVREAAVDGAKLIAEVENGISIMQATPATWRLMLEAGWQGSNSLKVLCGGEALPLQLAQKLAARARQVWNMYGPTETTVWSLVDSFQHTNNRVTIGKPIENTTAFVLDENMHPVMAGAQGELYLGGTGLARGYWNRPELTAERFLPNPFSEAGGERLYRTGDLVRWNKNEKLEFLGRTDHQVKIRGYRIELGEIEAALSKINGVNSSVVVAREDKPGEKRLVAYMSANPDVKDLRVNDLRNVLRQQLPEYMVPSAFVVLEQMPLTPNGKINRKALPQPETFSKDENYIAPSNEVERNLVQIWQDVLDLGRVSSNANFFELGGDSILSIQVIARARKSGFEITPQDIFKFQTVSELAGSLMSREPLNGQRHENAVTDMKTNAETSEEFSLVNLSEDELLELAAQLEE